MIYESVKSFQLFSHWLMGEGGGSYVWNGFDSVMYKIDFWPDKVRKWNL